MVNPSPPNPSPQACLHEAVSAKAGRGVSEERRRGEGMNTKEYFIFIVNEAS